MVPDTKTAVKRFWLEKRLYFLREPPSRSFRVSHDLRVSRSGAEGRYRAGGDGGKRRDAARAGGLVSGNPLPAPQGHNHDAEGEKDGGGGFWNLAGDVVR